STDLSMALFRLTTSSSARACSDSEVDSAADASSVARNLVIANRSNLNPGIGSLEAYDLAGAGEDYHVSSCAGFRSAGLRDYPHAPAAGDRKAPRHEVAGS